MHAGIGGPSGLGEESSWRDRSDAHASDSEEQRGQRMCDLAAPGLFVSKLNKPYEAGIPHAIVQTHLLPVVGGFLLLLYCSASLVSQALPSEYFEVDT